MYVIDDELKELLESGVAVSIGTADNNGRPHLGLAWGPRVHPDRTGLTIFLDTERADVTLGDLESNGRIAVTIADPVSYRSVQLKGRWQGASEATPEDNQWVQRHREAFLVTTALVGDPPPTVRNMWMEQVIRVDVEVDAAFDQTPGPDAGKTL